MANISINGVDYTDVPRIDVPITNGNDNAKFYDTSGDTATAADVMSGKTFHGANGADVGTATASEPTLQNKTVYAKESQQSVSCDSGYDGLDTVTVSPDNAMKAAWGAHTSDTVTIDLENAFGQANNNSERKFYGWGQYFMNSSTDVGDSTVNSQYFGAFGSPRYCKVVLPKNTQVIGSRAFSGMAGLVVIEAELDQGVRLESRAIYSCPNLTTLGNLWSKITSVTAQSIRPTLSGGFAATLENGNDIVCPMLTQMALTSDGYNQRAFCRCGFKSFTAPLLQNIGPQAFERCTYLQTVDFTALTTIGSQAFQNCSALRHIYLRGDSVVTLENVNAFQNLTASNITVHVPSSLVSSYRSATNWSNMYNNGMQFVAI